MNRLLLNVRTFLWVLSGSKISILKKCPTEHSRHSNIGLAIFATTLIAFFTGTLAGYEFGNQSTFVAVIFGLLWALLVFTIDRTMVLTFKKNPKISAIERRKTLIIPVLYRVFLSALISFFISIPLELWVFRENIELQMDKDKSAEINLKQDREANTYRIDDNKEKVEEYATSTDRLDSLLNQPTPPLNYKGYANIEKNAKDKKEEYLKLQSTYNKKVKDRRSIWSRIPIIYYYKDDVDEIQEKQDKSSEEYKKWEALWHETNLQGSLTKKLKGKKKEYENLESKLQEISDTYFNELSDKKSLEDSLKTEAQNELRNREDSVKTNTKIYSQKVKGHRGFITKWIALNNIENGWVVFFIWFIRVVFFTIEMLPTMAKVTTPVGSYDWEVFYEEENKKNSLFAIKDLEVEKLRKIEEQKLENELIVQKNILNKLAEKQNNIANKILDEWENTQIEAAKKDLDEFIAD